MIEKHRGSIIIDNPSKEEKEALSGFMKKDYSKSKSITINIKKFQKRLDETKFGGIAIKDIIECYFSENILSNKMAKQLYNEELESFFKEILLEFQDKKSARILNKILLEKSDNYIKLKSDYNRNSKILKENLFFVMKGIDKLPKIPQSLVMFSAGITGDPHCFDKNNLAGKLFIMFLEEKEDVRRKRKNSEEVSELYYKNNLLIDEMSNMVLAVNLIGYLKNEVHQGWQEFCKKHEPFQITLYNLTKVDRIETKLKKCLIVENPAVFTALITNAKMKDFPIVCTYGQVKLAGIVLLDYLVKYGTILYYSGDIDPEGMLIADKLKRRFRDKMNLIGFDRRTYNDNKSNVRISDVRLKKLDLLEDANLRELGKVVKEEKRAAYEEKNVIGIVESLI